MTKTILLLMIHLALFSLQGYAAIDAIGVSSGFLEAKIDEKIDRYEGIPLFLSFDFDAKPVFSKINFHPNGYLNFVVEPFVNPIIDPAHDVEIGTHFLLKYAHPIITERLYFYGKLGTGIVWMSYHVRKQSTQFNFVSQFGGGMHLFLNDTTALNLEYRRRHLSNCRVRRPNNGFNADIILCGMSYFFN